MFGFRNGPQVLVEAPGRAPILHSGDCRWTAGRDAERDAVLDAVRGRCQLVLDTTYCAPQHTFPPQVLLQPSASFDHGLWPHQTEIYMLKESLQRLHSHLCRAPRRHVQCPAAPWNPIVHGVPYFVTISAGARWR